MVSLLPTERVIGLVSVVYALLAALAVAISWKFSENTQTVWGSIWFAVSGATALQLVLLGWLYFGWKRLWGWFPTLNRLMFPDMGGESEIESHWQREGDSGIVNAEATIKQDFVRISMEVVRSPKSESQTLLISP
jgi:hypothetical protein